jgi:hypothetical protein
MNSGRHSKRSARQSRDMLRVTSKAVNAAGPRTAPKANRRRRASPPALLERAPRHPQRGEPAVRVVVAEGLLPVVHDYITRFLRRHGDAEAGGMLLGEFRGHGDVPRFKIYGLIDAGPEAEFSADSILFDNEYQAQVLQTLRQQHPQAGNMGCIHLHPDQMDECSLGDRLADMAAVKDSDTKALVFSIITLNNPRVDPASVCYRNFKFDFYVMAEQTGLKYVHVKPTLEPLAVVQVGPAPIWPTLPSARQPAELARAAGVPAAGATRYGRHYGGYPKLLSDKRRLVAEVRAMAERYGDKAVLRYRKNMLYWEYTVVESGRHFPVEVRYPRRYPLEPPQIFSKLPLPPSPHQLLGNEVCWTNRSVQGDWNPARDTAVTCINAAHRWFACLLVYLTLGTWPEEANDEFPRAL